MNKRFKILPLIMTILSALYVFYVCISKDTILNADAVGGDPGGKVIPYFMGIFMFIGFLYITFTEKPDGTKPDKTDRNLFMITVASVIIYIAFHRFFGFIIWSVALAYALTYIYTTVDEKRDYKAACVGLIITELGASATYMLFRTVTKSLLRKGRSGELPSIFGSSAFTATIALVLFATISVVIASTVCKKFKATKYAKISSAGIISFVLVIFLFIVFKQYFGVNLALGLLNY